MQRSNSIFVISEQFPPHNLDNYTFGHFCMDNLRAGSCVCTWAFDARSSDTHVRARPFRAAAFS